jgi:hypothetical protein
LLKSDLLIEFSGLNQKLTKKLLHFSVQADVFSFIGASEKLGNTWLPILAMIATGTASILGAWEFPFCFERTAPIGRCREPGQS